MSDRHQGAALLFWLQKDDLRLSLGLIGRMGSERCLCGILHRFLHDSLTETAQEDNSVELAHSPCLLLGTGDKSLHSGMDY